MMIVRWTPKSEESCCAPYFTRRFWGHNYRNHGNYENCNCSNEMAKPMNQGLDKESVKDSDTEMTENSSVISWYPATDIFDTGDNYVLRMEVPGVDRKDVNIEVNENILSVQGKRKVENSDEKYDFRLAESKKGKFHRDFRLPRMVDGSKISASLKDGVLELRVPKPEEQKPKNIPITVH